MVNELPKRIFQKFDKIIEENGSGEVMLHNCQYEPARSSTSYASLAKPFSDLTDHLRCFGPGPFPSSHSLMLLLCIIALHVPSSPTFLAATSCINSYEGFPLARSAFAQSQFMIQLLLCLGAEPSRKGNLALYIAIRSGWLDGLKMMVEREEGRLLAWEAAMQGIRRWFRQSEDERRRSNRANSTTPPPPPSGAVLPPATHASTQEDPKVDQMSTEKASTDYASKKRRRLLDRAHMDSKMLKEAVKHNRWPVANWLRGKGVVPDLRTIKLIELKQGSSA